MVGALRGRRGRAGAAARRRRRRAAGHDQRRSDRCAIDVELSGDLDDLRPARSTPRVYRLAQESITNAVRHARNATRVDVRRRSAPTTGSADGVATTASPASANAGLDGLRPARHAERAKLLGGTFTAGPRPDGGWTVDAVLPKAGEPRMTIRVLVADDQDLVRTGLVDDPRRPAGHRGRRRGRRRAEAVELARRLRPDVCLFDIRMPELDGIEATRQLAGPDVADPLAVVVITTFDLDEYVHGALKAGARGFLLKDAGPELLVQAIHAAANGDALIAPSITARLLATFSATGPTAPPAEPIEPLTDREEEVLVTVARGRTNAEIADELHISLSTVKTHIASLMTKLGARNRVEIAMWAYETGRVRR